jgi:hypothetical protein|tara:strand:- start:1688 stop:1933 length:246 start_codon:yes stop_codon:yes gene_type:complete
MSELFRRGNKATPASPGRGIDRLGGMGNTREWEKKRPMASPDPSPPITKEKLKSTPTLDQRIAEALRKGEAARAASKTRQF